MYVLSEKDPWGSLMAWEEKRIETRSFCPPWVITGQLPIRVALHISKTLDPADRHMCFYNGAFRHVLEKHDVTFRLRARGYEGEDSYDPLGLLPAGHIVATYTLLTVEPMDGPLIPGRLQHMAYNRWPKWDAQQELAFGHYAAGRWAYLITDVRLLPAPIPVKGALGFWHWTPLMAVTQEKEIV